MDHLARRRIYYYLFLAMFNGSSLFICHTLVGIFLFVSKCTVGRFTEVLLGMYHHILEKKNPSQEKATKKIVHSEPHKEPYGPNRKNILTRPDAENKIFLRKIAQHLIKNTMGHPLVLMVSKPKHVYSFEIAVVAEAVS